MPWGIAVANSPIVVFREEECRLSRAYSEFVGTRKAERRYLNLIGTRENKGTSSQCTTLEIVVTI